MTEHLSVFAIACQLGLAGSMTAGPVRINSAPVATHHAWRLPMSKAQARKLAQAPIEDVAFPDDSLLTRT